MRTVSAMCAYVGNNNKRIIDLMSTEKSTKHVFLFADVIARAKECFGCLRDVEFAALLGMSPQTLNNRKKTESIPYAELMALALERGADVQYILTGMRSGGAANAPPVPEGGETVALTRQEKALIENLRECDKEDRDAIGRMALRSAKAQYRDVETTTVKQKKTA